MRALNRTGSLSIVSALIIYLVTSEGDRLNLKSKLCQLVGLTKLIEGGKIAEACIYCDNKNDESKLFRFNLLGDTGNAEIA